MKTISMLMLTAMLASVVAGCSNKSEGPQEITPTSSLQATEEASPTDMVPVDKEPGLVKNAAPVYPEEAMKNGLEGTVFVKILVDTEGKVKDAVIAKSDGEIFNQASIDAAKQFQFTPAMKRASPFPSGLSCRSNTSWQISQKPGEKSSPSSRAREQRAGNLER